MKNAIIISASSDIGSELAFYWAAKNWNVYGTYRKGSAKVEELKSTPRIQMVSCDLLDPSTRDRAALDLCRLCPRWDILVFASGILSPVGPFSDVSFGEWANGMHVNFLQPLSLLHQLLPFRNTQRETVPSVLFFAGGGTNNAVKHYSSYTVSKIALIKMVELLDAEIPDTKFVIVGPGWVKTKIHKESLETKLSSESVLKTAEKYRSGDFVPMAKVLECCHWLVTTESPGVKGRNFSVAHDSWGEKALEKELEADPDMFKLRRAKNGIKVSV